MEFSGDQFRLSIDEAVVTPSSKSYRPPSWPPPRDWVCVEDKYGNGVSLWGDPVWDLSPWANKSCSLNFCDGKKITSRSPKIDGKNADDLRLLVTWRVWRARGVRSTRTLLTGFFFPIRKIFVICSKHGILARDLIKFPAVVDELSLSITNRDFCRITYELEIMLDDRDYIGFSILDRQGINRLRSAWKECLSHQTPYIPPRIWVYQVTRLRAFLDDFLDHRQKIEECFRFCVSAYRHNQGDSDFIRSLMAPFQSDPSRARKTGSGIFYGPFMATAERFGIKALLGRWLDNVTEKSSIQSFSKYLNLVQSVGLAYVLNFSLMRASEGASIRTDCLTWDEDEKWGKVLLISGETTKTVSDPRALWIVSPSIEVAIESMRSVAMLRLSCSDSPSHENPYLINWNDEPWTRGGGSKKRRSSSEIRPSVRPYSELQRLFPRLFEDDKMVSTEEDINIARMVDPRFDSDRFGVGRRWMLSWHQLRRTGAVNMFSSGMISDASIQMQLKHLTRNMSLYYGRGSSSLCLNDEVRSIIASAQYEAMDRELASLHSDRYLSPHGNKNKERLLSGASGSSFVNLIDEKDALRYGKAARDGKIYFRLTPLGACMNSGRCDSGDCVESVGSCAGNSDTAPCVHVLFDRTRALSNQARLKSVNALLADTPIDTPRYSALEQERRGLENYFAYINQG